MLAAVSVSVSEAYDNDMTRLMVYDDVLSMQSMSQSENQYESLVTSKNELHFFKGMRIPNQSHFTKSDWEKQPALIGTDERLSKPPFKTHLAQTRNALGPTWLMAFHMCAASSRRSTAGHRMTGSCLITHDSDAPHGYICLPNTKPACQLIET